jgi:hypothetical protein
MLIFLVPPRAKYSQFFEPIKAEVVKMSSLPINSSSRFLLSSGLILLLLDFPVLGQVTTRTEQIEQQRRDKESKAWPERTNGIIK